MGDLKSNLGQVKVKCGFIQWAGLASLPKSHLIGTIYVYAPTSR